MGAPVYQIITVCSAACSTYQQIKHQCSGLLTPQEGELPATARSPHKGPVMRCCHVIASSRVTAVIDTSGAASIHALWYITLTIKIPLYISWVIVLVGTVRLCTQYRSVDNTQAKIGICNWHGIRVHKLCVCHNWHGIRMQSNRKSMDLTCVMLKQTDTERLWVINTVHRVHVTFTHSMTLYEH